MGTLGLIIGTVYALLALLMILTLWRLFELLPVLTQLATTAQRFLRTKEPEGRSPERRLLDIEDLLRLKKITTEEYEAKRQEILKDL